MSATLIEPVHKARQRLLERVRATWHPNQKAKGTEGLIFNPFVPFCPPRRGQGFGGDVATRPDSRDAPLSFRLGLIEQLAEEMTSELRERKQAAIDEAANSRRGTITRRLTVKGVDFGQITVSRDGTVDTSTVEGVAEDLRVRPFFHQGGTASIREFIVDAFKEEMGMQAYDAVLCSVTDPVNPVSATSRRKQARYSAAS